MRDIRGGEKQWEWVKKGVPLRVEIGPRDVDNNAVMVNRRDRDTSEKQTVDRAASSAQRSLPALGEIRAGLLRPRARVPQRAHARDRYARTSSPRSSRRRTRRKPEIHGGFAVSPWCGSAECEAWAKDELKVTIRVIPVDELEDVMGLHELRRLRAAEGRDGSIRKGVLVRKFIPREDAGSMGASRENLAHVAEMIR